MDAALLAIDRLNTALQGKRMTRTAADLAERIGPVLWALAGAPELTPPEPPPEPPPALALREVA